MSSSSLLFVVTGANRGIGLEVVRQLLAGGSNRKIVATCRAASDGEKALEALGRPANVTFRPLDVTDSAAIAAFASTLAGLEIEALINNSAVKIDPDTAESATTTMAINVAGLVNVTRAVLAQAAAVKRVVNVSSEMGKLDRCSAARKKKIVAADTVDAVVQLSNEFVADLDTGRVIQRESAYSVSKALVNRITRVLAVQFPDVFFAATSPNWCRTDMGGGAAPFSAEHGGASIVHSAVTPRTELGESGQFWQDGKVLSD